MRKPGDHFQFERNGYFVADSVLSKPGKPVFNRTVTLRDSWAKIEQEALAAAEKTATTRTSGARRPARVSRRNFDQARRAARAYIGAVLEERASR